MARHMSDEYWTNFIIAARTSGLTDTMWCEKHGISKSVFYYHARKLRNKGIELPEATGVCSVAVKQEVVPVNFFDEEPVPAVAITPPHGESALCLHLNDAKVEINNHAIPALIEVTLQALRRLC